MKYKKIALFLGMLGVSTSSLFANETAAQNLFDTKCMMCHIKTVPSDPSALVAPPINGVMRHVKMAYPTQDQAVSFIVDYVQNPSKSKAVCMPQKISRFGLMPSQKGNVTPQEIQTIAQWLYKNYPSKNFRGGGMMRGKGQGMMQGGSMMRGGGMQ